MTATINYVGDIAVDGPYTSGWVFPEFYYIIDGPDFTTTVEAPTANEAFVAAVNYAKAVAA